MIFDILKWSLIFIFVLGTLPAAAIAMKDKPNMSAGRGVAIAAVTIANAALIAVVTLWWQS